MAFQRAGKSNVPIARSAKVDAGLPGSSSRSVKERIIFSPTCSHPRVSHALADHALTCGVMTPTSRLPRRRSKKFVESYESGVRLDHLGLDRKELLHLESRTPPMRRRADRHGVSASRKLRLRIGC